LASKSAQGRAKHYLNQNILCLQNKGKKRKTRDLGLVRGTRKIRHYVGKKVTQWEWRRRGRQN